MFITILLSLLLLFLTLIAASFHLPHLGLLVLLIILIFRNKHYLWLLIEIGVLTSLLGQLSLGFALLTVCTLSLIYLWARENVLPERKLGGILLALVMVVVWEIASYLVF